MIDTDYDINIAIFIISIVKDFIFYFQAQYRLKYFKITEFYVMLKE